MWINSDRVRIGLESHGRTKLDADIDLSRTVGWFTASYPFAVVLDQNRKLVSDIRIVKEQYRLIPNLGIEFGMSRYLEPQDNSLTRQPQILFNYLGRSQATDHQLLQVVNTLEDTSRAADNVREQQIEVNAGITAGSLEIKWAYSTAIHSRQSIVKQAARLEQEIREIIEHCLSSGAGGFTPSDFPDIGLNQAELDELLDDLDR